MGWRTPVEGAGHPRQTAPGSAATELPEPISLAPEMPEEPKVDTQAFEKETVMIRYYITRADLAQHGHTAGCRACEATTTGSRVPGIAHSDWCRKRLEEAVRESERYLKAGERLSNQIVEFTEREKRKRQADGPASEERETQVARRQLVSTAAHGQEGTSMNVAQGLSSGSRLLVSAPYHPGGTRATQGSSLVVAQGLSESNRMFVSTLTPGDTTAVTPGGASSSLRPAQVDLGVSVGPSFSNTRKRTVEEADIELMLEKMVESAREETLYQIEECANSRGDKMPTCDEAEETWVGEEEWDNYTDNVSGRALESSGVNKARK
jgi:hypothetical protein